MQADPQTARIWRWFFPLSFALLFALVGLIAHLLVRETDRSLRAELLEKARMLSWSLRADQLAKLTGTERDLASPHYQRIKRQLELSLGFYPECRFLYVLRKTGDGPPIFLVESEPADSPDHSPPGQVFTEATPELVATFRTGIAITETAKDRWGHWTSALVPIFDPLDSRVVAVLGMDVDSRQWHRFLWPATYPALVFGLATAVLLLAIWRRIIRRHRAGAPSKNHWWEREEVQIVCGLGVLLSAIAAFMACERDYARSKAATWEASAVQCSLMQQFLFRIGANYLEGIARLFMSSDFVSLADFKSFVGFLTDRPYAHAWCWTPLVESSDRVSFERAVRQGEMPDFRIWERDADGLQTPAAHRNLHFPICYQQPESSSPDAVGFDQATVSALQSAIWAAASNDAPIATEPLPPDLLPGGPRSIVIYRALRNEGATQPYGFVSAALKPDALLARVLSRDMTDPIDGRAVYLFQVDHGHAPHYLASSHSGESRILENPPTMEDVATRENAIVAPVLDFGHAYALVTVPDTTLYRAACLRAAGRTGGVGLLMTLLISALVHVLSNRRVALESMVAARTAELQASEGSYRGLFNSIRQAIYIQDETGRFLDVNNGAVAMYGYAREDFIGRTPEFLSAAGKNDLGALQRSFALAWAGEPQFFPFWGRRKSGEEFPKDVWLSKGSYFGRDVLIAIAADVSDRHRSEEEQNRLQQQLQQSQKLESIGRLAGGVAHDFNNMLQAILGFTGLAIEQNRDADIGEYLAEIRRSAERSADLTRQLLAFASRQTAKPRVVDLNATIENAIKMLGRLINEDIRLDWKPGHNIGCINIDPTQMDQILANLVVNARDAIQGGGVITIGTSIRACTSAQPCSRFIPVEDGTYAQITVQDTGRGMNAAMQSHLFEPFFTTKAQGKGVGLGLATVFGIVKQNNGFLDVASKPGAGTTFTIGFPSVAETAPAQEQPEPPAATLRGTETILLVEDENAILRFGSEFLKGLGYHVLVANSPRQALDRCDAFEGPIHLLITDVVLPEMNGRDLAEKLSRKRPAMKCIFMSGYTADIMASHGLLNHDIHFIAKPFSADDLAVRIREVLAHSPTA